jgi:DNA-directed RNA polymerase specialized sigma24 family protein
MSEPKKKRNYVNNPEFLQAIIDYKKVCDEAEEAGEPNPQIPNYIGECIYQIATRLATKPNFSGYTYKEEMISDGLENAIQALGNFNPQKSSNPFAYFTQIIWYAFLRRIDKEKKQVYIRHKVTENSMLTGTLVEHGENGSDQTDVNFVDLQNDYITDFVEQYETRMEKKKKQTTKSKKGLEKFIDEDNVNADSDPE